MRRIIGLGIMLHLAGAHLAVAGGADVLDVIVTSEKAGIFDFETTVQHADEGWEHYADRWEILGPDQLLLAERVLQHPHVDEQPFTRALSGVKIGEGVETVTVRAHDSVHDYDGEEMQVRLPR